VTGSALPPLPELETIQARLPRIFPQGTGPCRRPAPSIAWGSFVWFVSEPDAS
jgi:hypothetical protein